MERKKFMIFFLVWTISVGSCNNDSSSYLIRRYQKDFEKCNIDPQSNSAPWMCKVLFKRDIKPLPPNNTRIERREIKEDRDTKFNLNILPFDDTLEFAADPRIFPNLSSYNGTSNDQFSVIPIKKKKLKRLYAYTTSDTTVTPENIYSFEQNSSVNEEDGGSDMGDRVLPTDNPHIHVTEIVRNTREYDYSRTTNDVKYTTRQNVDYLSTKSYMPFNTKYPDIISMSDGQWVEDKSDFNDLDSLSMSDFEAKDLKSDLGEEASGSQGSAFELSTASTPGTTLHLVSQEGTTPHLVFDSIFSYDSSTLPHLIQDVPPAIITIPFEDQDSILDNESKSRVITLLPFPGTSETTTNEKLPEEITTASSFTTLHLVFDETSLDNTSEEPSETTLEISLDTSLETIPETTTEATPTKPPKTIQRTTQRSTKNPERVTRNTSQTVPPKTSRGSDRSESLMSFLSVDMKDYGDSDYLNEKASIEFDGKRPLNYSRVRNRSNSSIMEQTATTYDFKLFPGREKNTRSMNSTRNKTKELDSEEQSLIEFGEESSIISFGTGYKKQLPPKENDVPEHDLGGLTFGIETQMPPGYTSVQTSDSKVEFETEDSAENSQESSNSEEGSDEASEEDTKSNVTKNSIDFLSSLGSSILSVATVASRKSHKSTTQKITTTTNKTGTANKEEELSVFITDSDSDTEVTSNLIDDKTSTGTNAMPLHTKDLLKILETPTTQLNPTQANFFEEDHTDEYMGDNINTFENTDRVTSSTVTSILITKHTSDQPDDYEGLEFMQDNEEKAAVASSTDGMSHVTANNQNDNNNADRNSLSHFATSQMDKSNADIHPEIADNKSINNGDENEDDDEEDDEDDDDEEDENGDNISRKGKTKEHNKTDFGDYSDKVSKDEKTEHGVEHSMKTGTEHENDDQFETLENMEVEYQRKAFDSKRTTGEYVQEEQSYSGEDETKCCCSCPINQKSCGCCCNHPTKKLEPIVSSVSLPEPEKNISTKIYLEKSKKEGVHTFDVGTDEETGSDFYGDKVSSSSRVVTEKNKIMEDPPMEEGDFETNDQSEINEETNSISFPSENNNSEDQFLEEVNKKTEFDYLDSAMKDINIENENDAGSMTSMPANDIREDDTFVDDEDFSRQKRSSKQKMSSATEKVEDDYDVQSVNSRVTFKDNSKDHCCCYCKKDETCCCICKQTVDDDGGRSIAAQSNDLRKVESQSFGTMEDEDNKNLEVDFEESMADFSYSKGNENSNEFDASGDGIDNRQEEEYDADNTLKINNDEDLEAFEYLDEAESRYIPKKFFPDFFKNLSSYFVQELPEIKSKTTTKIAPPKSFIVKEVIRFNHTRDYQTYEIKFSMFTKIVFGQEITKDIKVTGRSFKRNIITEIVQCNNTNYDTKIDVSLSRGQFIYFSSCYKPTNGNKNIKIIRVDSLQIGNVSKKIEVTTLKTRNVPAIKIVLDVAFSGIKLGRRFDIKEIAAETDGNHNTYSTTINSDEVINETNTLLETEDEKDKKLDYFYKKFKELSYILNLYTTHGAKNRSKVSKHNKKSLNKANLTGNEGLNQISLAKKGSKRAGDDIFFDEKDAQELPIRTRSIVYPTKNLNRTYNSSFNSTANTIFNNIYNLIYKIVQDLTALDKMEVMLIKTTGTNGTLNPMNLKELSKYISKLIVKKVMESNPNNLTTISDILFGKRGIASEIISKKELLEQLRNITLESLSALPKKEDIEVNELLKLVTVPVLRRKDMKKRKKLKKLADSFRNKGYFREEEMSTKQVTILPREKKSKNQMTALYDDNQMTFLVRPFRNQKTAHSKGKHMNNKMDADKFELEMIEIEETPWKPPERRKFVEKGYIFPKMFDMTAIHVDKSENLSMNLNGRTTPEAMTERPKLVVNEITESATTSKSKVTGYKDEDFASPDEIIEGGVSTQLDEDVVFENGLSSTAVMEMAYDYNIRKSSTESTTARYGDGYKNVRELIVKNIGGDKINETSTNIKLKIPPKVQNSSTIPSTWTARRRKVMKVVRKNHIPLKKFLKAKKNYTEEILTNITETLSVKEVGQKEVVLSEESIYSEVTNKIDEKKISLLRNNKSGPIIDKPPTSFMDLFKLFERYGF